MPILNTRRDFDPAGAVRIALSFPFHQDVIRSANVLVPRDWRRRIQDRAADPVTASNPGLNVALCLEGNTGTLFLTQTRKLFEGTRFLDTILIYPDPVTLDGSTSKFNAGHSAVQAGVFPGDDEGMVVEFLHHLRTSLQRDYDAFAAEMNAAKAGQPGWVPIVTGIDVLNPKGLFGVGYSGGALMLYRLATFFPASRPGDPYVYALAAVALYAGCAGGYRQSANVGTLSFAWQLIPAAPVSLLHVQGSLDDNVSSTTLISLGDPANPVVPPAADATILVSASRPDGAPGNVPDETVQGFLGLGYDDQYAIDEARWDYSTNASIDIWVNGTGIGASPVVRAVTVTKALYPWGTLPTSTKRSVDIVDQVSGTFEVLLLVIDQENHSLPTTAWPDMFDYFAGFLLGHPLP